VEGLDNSLDNGYFQFFYNNAISNAGYSPGSGATICVLDASGQLFMSGFGYVAGTFSGQTSQNIYFTPPTGGYPSGFEPLTCNIDDLILSCHSNNGGGDTLFVNTGEDQIVGYLSIGSSTPSDGAVVPINVDLA
jgi:hypothetical protein